MTSGYIASASFAQRQLRYLDLLQPGGSHYAVPLVLEISGDVSIEALKHAFDAVIQRHDILRAALPLVDGTPVLAVHDELAVDLPETTIEAATPAQWRQSLAKAVTRMVAKPFNLEKGPVVAAALFRPDDPQTANCRASLAVVFHHAVADGGSLPLFVDDLVAAYEAALAHSAPKWPELALQYPDYADWEQENFGAPDAPALAGALRYWRDKLQGAPALQDLPLDRPRGGTSPDTPGATARLQLPGELGQALTELARGHGTTTFMVFMTVFFTVLHRWSGLDDLIVTVPVSKRTRPELSRMIGLLVDTLPLRLACDPDTRFPALLENVHNLFREGIHHRDVPFQRIVQAVDIERRTDVVPLMQILFGSLDPQDGPVAASDGTRFAVVDDQADQAAKADISLVYRQAAGHVDLWCRYDRGLFDARTIDNLLGWFGTVAQAIAREPDQPVGDLPLIDHDAGRALAARFNRTQREYPADESVYTLFQRAAQRHPDGIAIEDNGRLTRYGELLDQTARLAAVLAADGVRPGDPVVLAIALSDEFLAVMLAILRIGAIYVPLDPAHPRAHRVRLARSVGARAVVAPEFTAPDAYDGIPVLDVSTLITRAAASDAADAHGHTPDTAYIMFTSGSTGQPKGVSVPHRAIARLVCNTNFAAFGPDTRSAVYSNPSFDASTLEIWAPLLNGGTAIVVDRQSMLDAQALRRTLAESNITLLWVTAGLFQEIAGLDPSVFAGNRLVMTGGDTVSPDAARAVLAAGAGTGLRLLNGYGPTENTTFSTTFDIAGLDPRSLSVPIGRPIANSTAYILDRRGQVLPVGVTGEIHVGGDGVANGYVGDPERTAQAFLPDPFSTRPGARMYRTGDHGRWRDDGAILFSGRSDDQVKVRGFRIELNEIAATLGRHPKLRAVHVAAPKAANGARQVVAYVVAQAGPAPAAAELRQFLEPLLPSHMLPHAYVPVESLVLNLNGKVDRKALPTVQDQHYDRSAHSVAPRTEHERTLHAIWKGLLGLDDLGVTDSFFHVGGDSILAIRMAAQATEAGLTLTPADIFQLQTIERLAQAASMARPRPQHGASDRLFPAELAPITGYPEPTSPFLLASVIIDRPIGVVELALLIQRLAERHDALRLRCVREGPSRHLEIMAYVAQLPFRTVDAPDLDDEHLDGWVNAHAARLGRGLDTQTGVTIAATLVDRGRGREPVVVLALHRAIADAGTLALIASELETAIRSGHAALPALDGAATYNDWLAWVQHHADEQAAGEGLRTLENLATRHFAQPALASGRADMGAIAAMRRLDARTAGALADTAGVRLMVSPPDILATALTAAMATTAQSGRMLVEAVDGGRHFPQGAPDTGMLAGNLDSVLAIGAPVGPMPLDQRLHAVKAARQAVSAAASVYRVLGQTFDLPQAELGIAWVSQPNAPGAMRLHSAPTFGPSVRAALVVYADGPEPRLVWTGAEPEEGADALLHRVAQALDQLAGLAAHHPHPLHTPADFPLAGLSDDTLSAIVHKAPGVQDIYPLSPMQEAMLVHTLAATGSEINFEQSCTRIRGPLDHGAFRHAWATVFERHDILRTAFHWRGLARPLQVVHRHVEPPLARIDWPAFDADRLEAFLADDRKRGFDLEQAPLVRLSIIQVAPDDAYIVSSFHHLLVDGWCLGRLEREVRAAYESRRAHRPPLFDAPVAYRDYIAWLAKSDHADSTRFFAALLADLPPRRRLFPPPADTAHAFATARRMLSHEASRALVAFTRRRGLTLATALHFAWAAWLGARLGTGDVVFGTTVSGRPAGVAGVERIIGLFINNLPLRLRLADGDRPADLLDATQSLLGQLQSHAHLSPTAIAEAAGKHSGALFDTLVVVENLASGTSAWNGAEGLAVEAVHSRMKTAYDLTFVAIPGDAIALALVQPEDGRALEDGKAVLDAIAAILTALPEAADKTLADLPRPAARPPLESPANAAPEPSSIQFTTRPRSTLEALIADTVATLSVSPGATRPDLDTDFWSMGVSSLKLIQLAARLQQRLDRPVPISLLLEHRSVAALARAIASGQAWSPVVPMNGAGSAAAGTPQDTPFVCVHPVAGDVSVFLDLVRALPPSIPFWAIQAAGLEEGQTPLETIEELAHANLRALAERGLAQPRHIGGYSFGGLVAFEMARQLDLQGTPPARVVIIDTPAPLQRESVLDPDPDRAHAQWLARMADVRARFQGLEPVVTQEELLALPAAARFALALERMHAARLVPPAATPQWLERAHRTSLVQYGAYLAYTPPADAAGNLALSLIRADAPKASDLGELENRQLAIPDMGWRAFTGRPVDVLRVSGDHVTMLGPDTAPDVARAIGTLLAD